MIATAQIPAEHTFIEQVNLFKEILTYLRHVRPYQVRDLNIELIIVCIYSND